MISQGFKHSFGVEQRVARFAAALLFGTAIATVATVPVHAQVSDASLRGKITADGKPAATQVVAVEIESGYRRTVAVRPDGSYNFASLRPGRYRLEILTASGTRSTDEITLLVGQNSVLNFDFTVTEEAPAEEEGAIIVTAGKIQRLEGGEVGVNITQRLIEQLPQNNRNFLAFADLAPGAAFVTDGSDNTRLQGGAQDSRTINVFIDGIGQKDYVLKNGVTGQDSTQGNPFPQLAIGEYRVISSNYKAEFDQVSSVAITAVTKSGTNEFHGEAFIDYTDQSLRAARPIEAFTTAAGPAPGKVDTRDMQFGGALGGPIIKDVMHFFVTYEGKRRETPVDITPGEARPIESFPTQYQGFFGPTNRNFNEDLYFGKIDVAPSDKDLIEASVKYRKETGENLNSGQLAESTATNVDTEELRGLLRYEHKEDTWINDFKLTYEDVKWAPTPRVFENGSIFQDAADRTLLQIGGSANFQDKGQKGWGIQDDFTYLGVEDHTVKVGVKLKWVKLNTLQLNFTNAIYTYNADYGPSGFNDQIPWRVQFGAQSGPGDPTVESDNFQLGIYYQDDWDVTDRLTLNIGMRWDYEETPSFLDFVTPADAVAAVSPANYPNLNDADYNINDFISTGREREAFKGAWQPRLGFSYKLDEDGRFIVFGGAGRSYDRAQFDFLQTELSQGAFATRTFNFFPAPPNPLDPTSSCTPGPTCLAWDPIYLTPEGREQLLARVSNSGGGRELRFIDNNLKVPYSDQFSLGVRGRFNLLEAEVGVSHVESKDGFVWLLGNRRPDGSFFPPNAPPNSPFGFAPPGFGSIIIGTNGIETSADSAYLKLTKSYTPASPWSLDATYTYTEAEENRQFGETFALDYPSIADYPVVRSSGVRKHRFVAAGSVDLPWDFVFSGKVTLASAPYVKGFINQSVAPFERLVQAIEADNGLRQVDIALTKYIPVDFVSDEARIRLRVDILNLLNDRNYVDFVTNPTDPNFGKRSPSSFSVGGNPPRTIKLTAGFSF